MELQQPNTTRPPVYGVIGKPIYLHCMVSGPQEFTFSWKRNSGFIDDNIFPNGTLVISNYSNDDSGTYSCLVNKLCRTGERIDVAHIDLITASELLSHGVIDP